MASSGGLSVGGLVLVSAGSLLLYSSLAADHNPLNALRDILSGKKPAPIPAPAPAAGAPAPGAPAGPGTVHGPNAELETYLRSVAAGRGWSVQEADDWVWLVNHENSTWDPTRKNPGSTATGIGQFLDTTWATVGATKTFDAHTQIDLMAKYIVQHGYTLPSRAKAAWLAHSPHYY